jgi:hypothetical protein
VTQKQAAKVIRVKSFTLPPSLQRINPHLKNARKRKQASLVVILSPSLQRINPHLGRAVARIARDGDEIVAVIPGMKLHSEANMRCNWIARSRIAKAQRSEVAAMVSGNKPPPLPVSVVIERSGPRSLDSDNLTISAKHVRDEIAKWLGVNDGDESVAKWSVVQKIGEYAVSISVRGNAFAAKG